MTYKIIFTGRVPSKKNSLRRAIVKGRLLTLPSKAYTRWENEHLLELKAAKIPKLTPPYDITYRVYAPDLRRSDLSNKIESINDCLVKAGILQDDNWFVLQRIEILFCGVDRANPRIELTVKTPRYAVA